ncbi:hypothetical protein DIURU_000398 [Diutina rugosa]|uniref:tRNA (guanine(26)-N(2))-dimethyltransferase n=1 Tax=Diutina rugosa TaxID=5481 RepID=A0A642UXY0_DIURU|nr:uncharacterized protein DIURU_000398 [Diutina rugosa]KAA8907711.1 hypothetical protein DIURU_000398 [Diutina rugosa]
MRRVARAMEEGFQAIREGRAEILVPSDGSKVFYNKIQCFNRDLSVLGIRAWHEMRQAENASVAKRRRVAKEISILEALSATGLRANRYALEIPHVKKIVANDMLPEAVTSIQRNIDHNKTGDIVSTNLGDAIKFMASTPQKFNVVDLDPYGTASMFVDSAISCLEDNGLLLVTCTDAGVWAGSGYPEKCFSLYGGNNFGAAYSLNDTNHEVGLRLVLGMVSNIAARYGKAIEPLASFSIDYYLRCFIRVSHKPVEVKKLAQQTMVSFGCTGCGHKVNQSFGIQQGPHKCGYPKLNEELPGSNCRFCGGRYTIAGPMWGGPIHSTDYLDKILEVNREADPEVYHTRSRIEGMVTLARSELQDVPFYLNLNTVSSLVKAQPVPMDDFCQAIGNLGYKISLTHAKRNCVKTTAPWRDVLEVTRQWLTKSNANYAKEHANSEKESIQNKVKLITEDPTCSPNLNEQSPGYKVLQYLKQQTDLPTVDFTTENDEAKHVHSLRKLKIVRYQENPEKNWGPMARSDKK